MKLVVFFVSILCTLSIQAENRVFKLKVTNTKTGVSREILSTLDPQQYIGYNYFGAYDTVVILDHWMCWERRPRFSKLCTRPSAGKKKESEGPKTGSSRELASPPTENQ